MAHGRRTIDRRLRGLEDWPPVYGSDAGGASQPTREAIRADDGYIGRRAQETLLCRSLAVPTHRTYPFAPSFINCKVAQFLNRDETVETTGTARGGTLCGGLPGPNERC